MNINPFDIKNEVWDAPLLQTDEVSKNYINLEIKNWIGKINKLVIGGLFEKIKAGGFVAVVLSMTSEKFERMTISFTAKLSEYPELRMAKQNQEILIKKAKIKKIGCRNNLEGGVFQGGRVIEAIELYDCEIRLNPTEEKGAISEKEQEYQRAFTDYRQKETEFFESIHSKKDNLIKKRGDMIEAWGIVNEAIKELIKK